MFTRAKRMKVGPVGRARGPAPSALLSLAICLAMTALVTYGFHRAVDGRDEVRFHNAVDTVQAQVRDRLDTHVALLLAARGLLHARSGLTPGEFARFAVDLERGAPFPGVKCSFVELRGDDTSPDPTQAEAMARARDTGEPAASGPVGLVRESDAAQQADFFVYVPVYGGDERPTTVEERRRALRGFVYSPFRVHDFLEESVAAGPRTRVAFDLYDTEAAPENLIYRSAADEGEVPRFHDLAIMPIAGRSWVMASRSRPGLDVGSNRPLVGYVLATGLGLSGVFFGLALAHGRKQEQLKLQARVLESMGEGVSVSDEHGTILYTNPAEDEMFGYEPGELVGRNVTQQNAYPPEENAAIVRAVIAELKQKGAWVGEFRNVKKDGTPFTTLSRITALNVVGTTYFVCVQEDVTERRQAERERSELHEREKSARAQAEAASRAKDDFLAMLGHELRNPLSPILSGVQLMRRRGVQGVDRELELVERQVRHMVRLVDDLLDVSRIARGKIRIEKRPIEMACVVADAIETASPLLERHEHRLEVDVPDAGLLVDADRGRLAQVVANLLTNAAKFTDRGGRIEIAARRDADAVVVCVRDNGRGIAAELLPRIFELFTQGRGGTPPGSPGGLGIGLTLVQTLVSMHDGEVSARSEGPGRGSEFTIRLPASSRAAADVEDTGPVTSPQSRSQRILVVDDNADAADMLSELLRAKGHVVRVAYDGPQALAVAATFDFEIGVFDIGLPAMDGYELAERMRELQPAQLIAVTGYGQGQDVARAEQAGFARHFVKPVDIAQLLAAIESLSSGESECEVERA